MTVLPKPTTGTSLTCYVEIKKPNGVSKRYYKTVQVNSPTITTTDLANQVQRIVMDDLTESMQLMEKFKALSASMSEELKLDTQIKILEGIQGETTLLSDASIQSSVANTLQNIA